MSASVHSATTNITTVTCDVFNNAGILDLCIYSLISFLVCVCLFSFISQLSFVSLKLAFLYNPYYIYSF